MKFTILVEPSLFIITIYSACLLDSRSREKDFLQIYIDFTLFTPKLSPLNVLRTLVTALQITYNMSQIPKQYLYQFSFLCCLCNAFRKVKQNMKYIP